MNRNNAERKIAKKAQQMLQESFDRKFGGFKAHFMGKRTSENKYKPLAESKIKYRGRNWTSPQGDRIYYLNKIVLDMAKHGFVQHYGIKTMRESHMVERKKPTPKSFVRHAHKVNMAEHEFIDSAIEESGAVEFLAKEISEIRAYQVLNHYLDQMTIKINNHQKN